MKYYYDAEFIEGFLPNRLLGIPLPNLLSKRKHAIDLISISIVCEDGRVYSAISSDYHYDDASDWVKDNVLRKLYTRTVAGNDRNLIKENDFHKFFGKPNKQIASEIFRFMCSEKDAVLHAGTGSLDYGAENYLRLNPPELYGYYSDYDHVLFCSLFGTMMDLPKGFPMLTIDLKQMLDDRLMQMDDLTYSELFTFPRKPKYTSPNINFSAPLDNNIDKAETLKVKLADIKTLDSFPKQDDEHLADADAKWNMALHKFIETVLS